MHELKLNEKLLKRHLKNKQRVTLSLIISFLISGSVSYEEVEARDLRSRDRQKNNINPGSGGPDIKSSANETDVVDIVTPNSNGISHNKFIDLSIGSRNGLIFNNSKENGVSQIGGYLTKNPNLLNNATVILNEVTGTTTSNIDGDIEIFGKRADFILANENGISLNNATFINTGGVTLSTGRVTNLGSSIDFDVQRGEIKLNGAGTSGNYFNVLAKTIEIFKEVSPLAGEILPDISIIAGENKLNIGLQNLGSVDIVSSSKNESERYGIYATQLGAMHGKNIRLISTDKGLGVKHEGLVMSEKNININSNGDIILTNINSKGELNIIGDSLVTNEGTSINKGQEFINSISAKDNVNVEVKRDVVLKSVLQSTNGDVKIAGKDLIISKKKSALMGEQIKVFVDELKNENLILANKNLELSSKKITNEESGVIKGDSVTLKGELINNGDILADKNIQLISGGSIENGGKIGGDDISIQTLNGQFSNTGQVTAIKELEVIVKSLVNAGDEKSIERYLNIFYQYSEEKLEKAMKTIEELKEKLSDEANAEKKAELNKKLNYFIKLKVDLIALRDEIGKTVSLGILSGENIKIKSTEDIKNQGITIANKGVKIDGKNIKNYGVIQSRENIFLKATGNILNAQRLVAGEKINISGDTFTSIGDDMKISEYLKLVDLFNEKKLDSIKSKVSSFSGLGVVESDTLVITTIKNLENNGIILIKEDATISSQSDIKNSGLTDVGGDLDIRGREFISKNLTVGGKLKGAFDGLFETKDLKVGAGVDVLASKMLNTGKLDINEDLILKGDLESTSGSDIEVKRDIDISGGFNNRGKIINNGDLNIDTSNKDFINFGKLGIKGEGIVKGKNFTNSGEVLIEKGIDLVLDGSFQNKSVIMTKGDFSANTKEEFKSSNSLMVGGKAKIISSEESFNNSGNLHVLQELIVDTKNIINSGEIVSTGLDLIMNGDLDNTGSIQSNGDIDIKNESENSTVNSKGEIISTGNINIDAKDSEIVSNGKLAANGNLKIESKVFTNENKVESGDLTVVTDVFFNRENSIITADSVLITGNEVDFNNYGKIQSNKDVKIYLNGNLNDSNLGKISANKDIIFKGASGDLSIGKIQTPGDIFIETKGSLNNNGMIVSNKNITLSAGSIKNESGTTIWAGQNIVLSAIKDIYNSLLSVIEGKGDVTLTAKSLINDGGTIKSGKNMVIKADRVINKSTFIDKPLIENGSRELETVTRWDDILNYHLDYVKINIPNIENALIIKDKGIISSGGNLEMEGFSKKASDIQNEGATIYSSKDMTISGDIKNRTPYKEISIEWLLNNIKVKLYWETKLYGTGAHGNSGTSFEGSLREAFYKGYFGGKNSYYESLKIQNDSTLTKILSSFLGPDWKSHNKPVIQDKWNLNGGFKYYAANANAQILAGKKLTHSLGVFNNAGGESGDNKNIKVQIGDNTVEGVQSNIEVNIKDINSIKEIEGVKYIHDVEIIFGEIIIDGVTIKAKTGNIAGSVAVSGTINPIIFIDIPVGENGIFKPATPKPGQIQPLFETNIEFIDSTKFYGSDYFFKQIGYDKNKPSTVIGDAYYEYLLIAKMLEEAIKYTDVLAIDSVKRLLDNALKVEKKLGLEVGMPLTPNQISNLDRDIIWYVEIEIDGTKALTPQVYFSKDSRLKIADSQGNGGTSTVKVGTGFASDSKSFINTNGNIVVNGNIVIKSKENITNNSFGGMHGGVTSLNGNIALDSNKNIDIVGGSIKGDNIIISGDEINIESTLGIKEKGEQSISDKASIEGNNGIQIDVEKNINIKGGILTTKGMEIVPQEEPLNYENLFQKDGVDIISGPAGSVNINAGGSVNIEGIYTVSSDSKNNHEDHSNYLEEFSGKAISNESKIIGSHINIDVGKDINIKGSVLETNEKRITKDDKKEYLKGDINLNAKNSITIEDTRNIYFEKNSVKKSSVEEGLVTVKWTEKKSNSLLSEGSNILANGDLNITSGNDITVKGSRLDVTGDTMIDAKNNIEIIDGKDVIDSYTHNGRYQVIGGGSETVEKNSLLSKGSSISNSGNLTLNSGKDIKIANGELKSDGNTNLLAENNVSIEAGKNEYKEIVTTTDIGIYVDGSIGIGGVGVTGSATTSNMTASGEISNIWGGEGLVSEKLDGSNEKTPTTSGKPHMDQLVNSEVGLKIENSRKELDEVVWSESNLKGNNLTIIAGNTVDIGGGDYEAKNKINIKGKKVDTTKYEDARNERIDGFSIAIKQSQGVTSSIADTINTGIKMDEAIKEGQANEGVLVAQGVGIASNLILNDLAGVFSKQSTNISVEHSTKNETSENITSLKGKDITITTTGDNINLKGVDIKSEENIVLDAKKDINISAAKKTSDELGFKVDLEAQFEQTAGYSPLWGGNADIGVGGTANVDVNVSTSTEYVNSTIKSDGNIIIKSGGDTNIKGGEVEAIKDTNVKVGGNLNIESKKSTYKEDAINANVGGNVSLGAASNTVGKAEIGLSAGGGNIWKEGKIVKQSGIKSGGNLNVDVDRDLNMIAGILGSETGLGNLNVRGNVNLKDLVTSEKQGGAHITVSGGLTGDMGVDGTIGDERDKQVTSKSVIGLNMKNINIEGSIDINDQSGIIDNIYSDMKNTQIVNHDTLKKGGDISLSGSVESVKDAKNKVSKFKDKISSTKRKSGETGSNIELKAVPRNLGAIALKDESNGGDDRRTREQKEALKIPEKLSKYKKSEFDIKGDLKIDSHRKDELETPTKIIKTKYGEDIEYGGKIVFNDPIEGTSAGTPIDEKKLLLSNLIKLEEKLEKAEREGKVKTINVLRDQQKVLKEKIKNKAEREAIDKYREKEDKITAEIDRLWTILDSSVLTNGEKKVAEKRLDEFLKIMEENEKAFKKMDIAEETSDDVTKKIDVLKSEKFSVESNQSEKSFSQKVRDFFKKKKKIKVDKKEYIKTENGYMRREGEIKKQLDIVLNSGKNIPSEHLQDFVAKVLIGKESKGLPTERNIIIENERVGNFTEEDFKRLETIYSKLPNNFEVTRTQMDKELSRRLAGDQRLGELIFGGISTPLDKNFIIEKYDNNPDEVLKSALNGEFIKNKKISDETLINLTNIVQDNREPIFKKYTGTKFKPAKVEIMDYSNGNAAQYRKGVIEIDPISMASLSLALEVVIHESTHLEQDLISKDKNSKVDPLVKELYEINLSGGGYIYPTTIDQNKDFYSENEVTRNTGYRTQPVEAEAFNSMNTEEIIKKSLDIFIQKIKKEQFLISDKNKSEEIKISKLVDTEIFKKELEELKNKLKEKYGEEYGPSIDESFDLEDFKTKLAIREYLREGLAEEKIILTSGNLSTFSESMTNKFMSQFETHRKGFKVEKLGGGSNVFTRSSDEIKRQLEIVARDENHIPAEHIQNFLANLLLNKEATKINKSIVDGPTDIIINNSVTLDLASKINLYSLYEELPTPFKEGRKNLDNLLIEELGNNEVLKNFIAGDGFIERELMDAGYKEDPERIISVIYNFDISDMTDEVIKKIFDQIQMAREKNFEKETGIEYQNSELIISKNLNGQTAYHDSSDNTIRISRDKVLTLGELINILLHETQHNEQTLILSDETSDKISENTKDLYAINGRGYIDLNIDNPSLLEDIMYKGQLVEREAYTVMRAEEIIKSLIENIINS